MTTSQIVSAAALAYGAYRKLLKVATSRGMSADQFQLAVIEECRRLDNWLKSSNAVEDAVFRAPDNQDR